MRIMLSWSQSTEHLEREELNMNAYMQMSIKACIGYLDSFKQGIKVAAMKDDGAISRDEEKLVKRLNKATEKYQRELSDLIEE